MLGMPEAPRQALWVAPMRRPGLGAGWGPS